MNVPIPNTPQTMFSDPHLLSCLRTLPLIRSVSEHD